MLKILAFFVAVFAVLVQPAYMLSPIAKECSEKLNIDASTVRTFYVSEIPEDNELAQKFYACIFADNISDSNEFIVNDKAKEFAKKHLSYGGGSNFEDLDGVSFRLITDCAALKGDNKGLTVIKVLNCYAKKVTELQQH